MNTNINIAKILKDYPKGTKLYSPLFGDVTLEEINPTFKFPITVISSKNSCSAFSKTGLYYNYENAECLLFPSSEMRDWSKFFKRGDVLCHKDGNLYVVFESWANDDYTEFNTTDISFGKVEVCNTDCFVKASDEERAVFIANAERILKGKYNPETLQVEPVKPKCPFKPFDKVLVRNYDTDEWLPGFFYRLDKDWNYPYHIMNLHHLTDYAYLYCIPYEGNEHLLSTNNPYIEKDNE